MNQNFNYNKITEAINYIRNNHTLQPSLDDIANAVNLSPFHFQRLFTEWAGISPKKFLQFISLNHARILLKEKQATLFEAAAVTGLSGTSRLHDLFVTIEGMTPAEFKNGGKALTINYFEYPCIFGTALIANTNRGICYMAFSDNLEQTTNELKLLYPNAQLVHKAHELHIAAIAPLSNNIGSSAPIQLHVKGTPFQVKVWEALLNVPIGRLISYGQLAANVGNPSAARAVGSAVGDNPVAYLIPCHRVIQAGGNFGQYHWGQIRKTAIIGWEAAQNEI